MFTVFTTALATFAVCLITVAACRCVSSDTTHSNSCNLAPHQRHWISRKTVEEPDIFEDTATGPNRNDFSNVGQFRNEIWRSHCVDVGVRVPRNAKVLGRMRAEQDNLRVKNFIFDWGVFEDNYGYSGEVFGT